MQKHITVLQQEAIEALAIKNSSIIVDATLGSSGHAQQIISKLTAKGTFIGIDADETAVRGGEESLKGAKCITHLCVGNYRDIDSIVEKLKIKNVDGILADLGWRMEQFSGNGRGFSFQVDEELLMTFGDPSAYPFVAKDIVNEWKEEDLRNILTGYGEERFAYRIAKAIVEAREEKPILTTFDLVEVIQSAVPSKFQHGRTHPATKAFQALRITVNDEFDTLETFIKKSIALLVPHGRLAIITFHSLEDRIVKHLFRNLARDHVGIVVTKKPIIASEEELERNPRARSAKLRVFEKYEEI